MPIILRPSLVNHYAQEYKNLKTLDAETNFFEIQVPKFFVIHPPSPLLTYIELFREAQT